MGRCICSRNQGGKKLITKNETCAPLAAVLGTLSRNFEKKRYVVIFPITRSGRMQKVKQKKKKKKQFLLHVLPCGFPISSLKKAEKK